MSDSASQAALVEQVNRWSLHRMTGLNRDILHGVGQPGALKDEFKATVLARLPLPDEFSPVQAQQLLVLLGLAGASVGRHYQEADESHRATPVRAFAGLDVGADAIPFCTYFARLADRTGTGHCARDSFASLVRWNVPVAEVEWNGQILTRLPSVFRDGMVRTYTGAVDEQRFFGLLKASEVIERAVNLELMPLSEGTLALTDPEALLRIGRAVVLLDALRELNNDFADRPAGEGLQINHFMDVFRQFAVHWAPGDIPPSGALDAEALIRDLLVGIALPSYPEHIRRVSPGLLDTERAVLGTLLDRACLPQSALAIAGVTPDALATTSAQELHRITAGYPVLAALYLLLNAHARVAGVHLRLSKVFLFDPQRVRDHAGFGDLGVVSNRIGTTGMDETRLEMFTRVRRNHLLTPLRAIPARTLDALARPPLIATQLATSTGVRVRFTGTGMDPYELGLPASVNTLPHGRTSRLTLDQRVPEHTEPGLV